MKIKVGRLMLKDFCANAEADTDPYLVIHFSHEDDLYEASYYGLDALDVLVIIGDLIKQFNLLNSDEKKTFQSAIKRPPHISPN